MKRFLLILILCTSTAAQTGTPSLIDGDQKRLVVAYNEWQAAVEKANVAMLKFQAVAFESMARAKVSPDDYVLAPNKDGFTLQKKEVANEKTTVPKPAATPAKPGS